MKKQKLINEQERQEDSILPSIQYPMGGGAVKGIDEKFTVNPTTGTSSLRVPISLSTGRSGFTPNLVLTYDSGMGNGLFGLGWNCAIPSIKRKTDRKLPRYLDKHDTFLLSDAEDLVPISGEKLDSSGNYMIRQYRPRIEGLFARIERWEEKQSGTLHWKVISKENVTSIYGKSQECQIANPQTPDHVFEWLLEEQSDQKGNLISYQYKQEDGQNTQYEWCSSRIVSNRYPKKILYGNRYPYIKSDWLFQVVFDYGEHHSEQPSDLEITSWDGRKDPFSSFRSGFEIRTERLCKRLLMFHHMEELGELPCLVRSVDFTYDENQIVSYLKSITQVGYQKQTDGQYLRRSFPPIEYTYSLVNVDTTVHQLATSNELDIDGQWLDYENEGLQGILSQRENSWYFRRNLGNGTFSEQFIVQKQPSILGIDQTKQQWLDLDGDGRNEWVQIGGELTGFYQQDSAGDWKPFVPFESIPRIDWNDPNLRWIDLDGDGHPDLLITHDDQLMFSYSLAEKGFSSMQVLPAHRIEEQGPVLVFANEAESIFLADMNGDGLSDLIRLRNGEVCYWPNLGYGRFGLKVVMQNPPWLDDDELFDHNRIQLADLDGSGISDLFYMSSTGTKVWLNQSGNGWSEPLELFGIDFGAKIEVIDLFGTGTSCIVWSSPTSKDVCYIDPLASKKPHLLTLIQNNLGAETKITYASSTYFYLKDRADGKPWATRLPFPVQVVKQVESYDQINQNRLVTRYDYHHGYYDGVEREFRGFGMVEQWDAEEKFSTVSGNWLYATPPVRSKSWYHIGEYRDQMSLSQVFQREYFREPSRSEAESVALLLEDTVLPEGLTEAEKREACRALKGSLLRQEIYAEDSSSQSMYPFSVIEQNYTVKRLQPMGQQQHAVFYVHSRENLAYQYERVFHDPRVQHTVMLQVDDYGNVCTSVGINYGRRIVDPLLSPAEQAKQKQLWMTISENRYTQVVDTVNAFRTPLNWETSTYELTGLSLGQKERFLFHELVQAVEMASPIAYEVIPDDSLQKRLIEQVRTLYRNDDLSEALPWGQMESLALSYESYQLVFTDSLISQVYGTRVTERVLQQEGGYVRLLESDQWWLPSGKMIFAINAAEHFYLPTGFVDPFGNENTVQFDQYDLLPIETKDALQNVVQAQWDYRVLQPKQVMDPNGNRSSMSFDALGMVVGTAIMGKSEEKVGDLLDGFEPNLDETTILQHLENPLLNPQSIIQKATSRFVYDLFGFQRTRHLEQPQSACVYTLVREEHISDMSEDETSNYQHKLVYTDGFGREIQTKSWTEAGEVEGIWHETRWIGSGTTIFNNKGKPVRKYEPFFSSTHQLEVKQVGVSSTLFYDPLDRVVMTLHPDYTYEKVVFDAWKQETWDRNDTIHPTQLYDPRTPDQFPDYGFQPVDDPEVGEYFQLLPESDYLPTWYQLRMDEALAQIKWPDPESRLNENNAAKQAAKHSATPTVVYLDSLGRSFLSVADNGLDDQGNRQLYRSLIQFDIEGNKRVNIDAQGRIVMQTEFDLLGTVIQQKSMETGTRWLLQNVIGKPIHRWDERDYHIRHMYDPLHRPLGKYVSLASGQERLAECVIYGEKHPEAKARNLRTKPYMRLDGAGNTEQHTYDFKGNPIGASRRFTKEYKQQPDWISLESIITSKATEVLNLPLLEMILSPILENETFLTTTHYDALNRMTELITPDQSLIHPIFNQNNQLKQLSTLPPNSLSEKIVIDSITYDAKGQRQQIKYGNNTRTNYTYDPQTFRLTQLLTVRQGRINLLLQNFQFTYDPVGNITTSQDDARQSTYFNNQVVLPKSEYMYDALYRLIMASGREHIGLSTRSPQSSWNDAPRTRLPHLMDGQAIRSYIEQYQYDEVGNILALMHKAMDGSWARIYDYREGSQIQPSEKNNRLSSTSVGSLTETYQYDAHGNMTKMSHVTQIDWNEQNQIQKVELGGGGTAYYLYDSQGKRVRKVIERQTGTRLKERIYLGSLDIYREYGGDGTTVALERKSLHVLDGQRRVALIERRTQGNDGSPVELIRYQLGNHLDSAVLELDGLGNIISYEEFYPFGGTAFQSVRADIEVPLKRFRFTGRERDEETGFYYHGARYYASWIGRWTSCDPAGFVDGLNLYQYVRGNPVKLYDPSGMAGRKPDARYGDVKRHSKQGKSLYDAAGDRISESEHTMPKAQLKTLTKDLTTNISDYTDTHYDNNTTVVVEKNVAHDKTHVGLFGDNKRSERLKDFVDNGGNVNYKEDIFHPSLERIKEARDTAGSAVSDSQIHQAILSQDGEIFDIQELHETGTKIGASADDVNRAIDTLDDAFGTSSKPPSLLSKAKNIGGKVLGVTGDVASVVGAGVSGWKVGTGIDQVTQGEKALGVVNIVEGGSGLAIDIGAPALAAKGGAAVVGGSAAALGVTMAVAGASIGLAAETARSAIQGEKTPIDIADEFYGTHFGDIYGWATGAYRGKK
jgi:RHS repeat-associated protein